MTTLGSKYKCKITGFEGIATGRCVYITGCAQVLLAPPVGPDGAMREAHWFDESRLEEIGAEPLRLGNTVTPGFDKAAPKR